LRDKLRLLFGQNMPERAEAYRNVERSIEWHVENVATDQVNWRLAWGVRRHPSGDSQHPAAEIDADDPVATEQSQMP
jgi:hypothetical protein